MSKLLELRVRATWDTVMPEARWDRWDEGTDPEFDAACNADMMKFAEEISRAAFQDGVFFGMKNPTGTNGDMQKEMDKRYGPVKPKYRTSRRDSNGNRWQVRDGHTWVSLSGREWIKHVAVADVIAAMARLERHDDIAILLEIVQNPTE